MTNAVYGDLVLSPNLGRWFSIGLLGILGVTLVVLLAISYSRAQALQAAAALEASKYTPPPLATPVATKQVAVIGDSYAAGTGASSSAVDFVSLLALDEHWVVANEAVGGTGYVTQGSGACNGGACPTFDQAIETVTINPDIILVEGGRNDVEAPLARISSGVRTFYSDLRDRFPKAKIYAVSPIWDSTTPPAALADLQSSVRDSVTRVGGRYINIGEPLSGHRNLIISDGVHPNDLGHAAIAKAIESALP